jgi:hypothetical protein
MKLAGLGGEILPWRDTLHDGPVPHLPLGELSRLRASYLSSWGTDEYHVIAREFEARDSLLLKFREFERIVLWFEWDLYDQLQLAQILHFFAERVSALEKSRTHLEIVFVAGYLGSLPPDAYPPLHSQRKPVTSDMLALGHSAWRAFTSDDPRGMVGLMESESPMLPFLGAALHRGLEELPWTSDGLARSERQLLRSLHEGATRFGDVFRRATEMEERIYCGDVSAAQYVARMSQGVEPLVVNRDGGTVTPPRTAADYRSFGGYELALTDIGEAVLSGERDWIEIGGSDRWLGGLHLEGRSARWRWDSGRSTVTEARAA